MKAFAKLCASTALAGLLLSCASVPAAGYGTMNFCTATTRILSHLNVSLESDLTNYQGIGCETDPGVRITLDATAAPNGFGITCELSDGTIGSGGAVFLTNPVGTDAALVAPLRVKIERNVFEADAVLYVLGSFPTSSSISIANNTFNVGYPNDLYSAVGTNFISAITFGDVDTEQLLFTNAQVLIYLNKINVEDRTGDASNPLETYGIYMSSHVYLSQDSGLLMQRNNITGSSDKRSIGVYCPRYVFVLGNSTLAQISDNTIGLTNGVSLQSPAVATADTCIAAAEFSRNRIRLTPVHASTNAMILGPVNLSMTSELDVSDNTIVNEVTNGAFTLSSRILFNGPCVARENSTARIWFNTMNTKGGSPQINFGGPVMLEAHGSLWVVGNQMVRQEALVLGLSPVAFFSVSLRGDSSLSISQNTFGSENSNSAPLMVALSDSGAYLREENSTIDMCYDVYFGSTFASDAALAAAVSSRLREGLTSLDQCPEAITSVAPSAATTLTTKNYGTTVPSNNGAPAAHGLSTPTLAVMVAALGAVLSVLYC